MLPIVAKAIETNRSRTASEHANGLGAPEDGTASDLLEVAVSAVEAGISCATMAKTENTEGWSCVAEGFAMLLDLKKRLRREALQ